MFSFAHFLSDELIGRLSCSLVHLVTYCPSFSSTCSLTLYSIHPLTHVLIPSFTHSLMCSSLACALSSVFLVADSQIQFLTLSKARLPSLLPFVTHAFISLFSLSFSHWLDCQPVSSLTHPHLLSVSFLRFYLRISPLTYAQIIYVLIQSPDQSPEH